LHDYKEIPAKLQGKKLAADFRRPAATRNRRTPTTLKRLGKRGADPLGGPLIAIVVFQRRPTVRGVTGIEQLFMSFRLTRKPRKVSCVAPAPSPVHF
jgi:hypothetical protein